MEEENNNGWVITILIIVLIWAIFIHKDKYEGYTAEEWFYEYDYEVSVNDNLRNALEEANLNIDIAKLYAWSSYDDMGNALDGLQTVPEP